MDSTLTREAAVNEPRHVGRHLAKFNMVNVVKSSSGEDQGFQSRIALYTEKQFGIHANNNCVTFLFRGNVQLKLLFKLLASHYLDQILFRGDPAARRRTGMGRFLV